MAKQLGIDQRRIQIAGIKDAKAITAQHITIEGGRLEDAAKVNIKDIQVIPVGYVREALSTYYLLGNNFTIKIKAIKHKTINRQSTNSPDNRGNPSGRRDSKLFWAPTLWNHPSDNAFGWKSLVKGDFEEAAMLFLAKPSLYEHPASRQARQQLQETGNFKQALENFPQAASF